MKKQTAKPEVQATYQGYEGVKRYDVTAPGKRTILVSAPDENCAIVAAANYWGERWQNWEFYTGCIVGRRN